MRLKDIRNQLYMLQSEHTMKVIVAVESGSRPWGFASEDSDWDIRFIFKRPVQHLVTLYPRRDTIEHIVELKGETLDIVGWELGKAMKLGMKSNASPHEWLAVKSPIMDSPEAIHILRPLLRSYWEPITLCHHYKGIAQQNWNKYIVGRQVVRYKRYLYVIRGIINAQYAKEHMALPPQRLQDALDAVTLPATFMDAAQNLLNAKRDGELAQGPRIAALDEYPEVYPEERRRGLTPRTETQVDKCYLEMINWD